MHKAFVFSKWAFSRAKSGFFDPDSGRDDIKSPMVSGCVGGRKIDRIKSGGIVRKNAKITVAVYVPGTFWGGKVRKFSKRALGTPERKHCRS